MSPTWFDAEWQKYSEENRLKLLIEDLLFDFINELHRVMKEKKVTQKELARRMGKNPSFVSRMLGYSRSVTLKTVVEAAYALDPDCIWTRPVLATPQVGKALIFVNNCVHAYFKEEEEGEGEAAKEECEKV